MLVDAHNHFSYYQEDLNRALVDIKENEMLMVSVTTDFESYEATLKLAKQSEQILPAFGVHPMVAHEHTEKLDLIRKIADDALLLGEIGFDRLWLTDQTHYPAQVPLLDIFLESANKGDKVAILHLAGAELDVIDKLETYSIRRAIIHDYYGPVNLVNRIIDANLYFAFDRSYLEEYKPEVQNWDERLQIASMIPDDRFLIETDGPNKSPRRMPFEALQIVAERIAELRNSTPEEIHEQSARNFRNLISGSPGLDKFVKLLR